MADISPMEEEELAAVAVSDVEEEGQEDSASEVRKRPAGAVAKLDRIKQRCGFCGLCQAVVMTDGCSTYKCRCEQCARRFVQHESVNHSRKPTPELCRSVDVIADVEMSR
mmetsp:Transcript_1071/g.1992  ORF Transcript_1071/g.1992 Transcript_1071/m.1992 type:complete len:110 (+) Transcript_1071:88-417(+)